MSKENNKSRLFGLWFGLSLIGGLFAAGFLSGLIWITVGSMISGDPVTTNLYDAKAFVGIISALIVFGGIYAVGTFKSSSKLTEMRQKNDSVKVLSIIYSSFLAIPAIVMLVMFITPLIELGVGTTTDVTAAIAQLVCSLIAFALLTKMALYQIGFLNKWMGGKVWAIAFAVFSVVIIALFMIFPGEHIRAVTRDQKIIADLEIITDAIGDYTHSNKQLPTDLNALDIKGLETSINDFSFSAKESDKTNYLAYEICANFASDTGATRSYGFNNHPAGNVCFDRSVYVYQSSYLDIDVQ